MKTLTQTLSLSTLDQHMVRIEGGSFDMGSDEYKDEKPIHQVTLSSFALCRYPVTQGFWREVMGANPQELYFIGADRPVGRVSWEDCQVFINRLNGLAGTSGASVSEETTTYRLPTEAEWEYAARGGKYSQGFEHSGSADLDEVGWYNGDSYGETQPTGLKLPNALGLYDLNGNVWEWCFDRYNYYSCGPQTNPRGSADGGHRAGRGGCWLYNAALARVSTRYLWFPNRRDFRIGFRLARSL
ncbi:MAG: formylglycine-generating enzyme family protein [Bacteroidetes bacterium]|nr:MAG: formylglycine-generating enzyme family protein [Bacteroidota bacterium]